MRELVLDASVLLKWFLRDESGADDAGRIRRDYEAGALAIAAPSLLWLEIINVAGRRWGWSERDLMDLAQDLEALGFEILDPAPTSVASWTAAGLTAYDAAYVAVAEERGIQLVTDDRRIVTTAPALAVALSH